MSKTVLVAGATGNLGSEIVADLVARGATVRALVRESKADGGDRLRNLAEAGAITLVVGDVSDDVATLSDQLRGVDPCHPEFSQPNCALPTIPRRR